MAERPRPAGNPHKRERTRKTLRADDAQEPRFLPLPLPSPSTTTTNTHPPLSKPGPGSVPQTHPNPLPPSVLPPSLASLADTHTISTMSILSSSQIKQKVSSLLNHLSPPASLEVEQSGKPRLVVLHAKAPCAGKLVSVVEIAKREVAARDRDEGRDGKVYQYSRVGSELVELKVKGNGKGNGKGKEGGTEGRGVEGGKTVGGDGDGTGDEDDEEDEPAFETMEVQERKKVRAVPVMTVFLCRLPVHALEELFGYYRGHGYGLFGTGEVRKTYSPSCTRLYSASQTILELLRNYWLGTQSEK